MALPPGPRSPTIVQTLDWVFRPARFMERCRARYGDYFTVNLMGLGPGGRARVVFVSDPAAVKQIFTADQTVLRAGAARDSMEPMFGRRSILLVDGEQHLRGRKLMLPPFHGQRVARYAEAIAAITRADLERWPRGKPFALQPHMQAITLEVILEIVFGVTTGERRDSLRAEIQRVLATVANPFAELAMGLPEKIGPLNLRGGFLKTLRRTDAVLLDEIAMRRRDPRLAEREDILSMLLLARDESGGAMSDRELRDQLVTLLLAGHETTATGLAWAVDQLLHQPDALERATDEAKSGDRDRPYLEAVVKEALRMRPPIPIVDRLLMQPLELGGYTLPAGTIVAPCVYLVHHREDIYPDPYEFRPDRFLAAKPDTYAWLPFGGGIRRCIGASFAQMEMEIVLRTILAGVDLVPARRNLETIHRRAIVLAPRRGMRVRVGELA